MRLRLVDWARQEGSPNPLVAASLDRSDLDALLMHSRYDRWRPFAAALRLLGDFVTFCRWRAEIHLTGHRVGPTGRLVFQRPRSTGGPSARP